MTDAEEAALVAKIRSGDEAAFAAIVDAHSPTLTRLVRSFVKNDAIAEELVQDTWVAVIDAIESFEGRSSLKTWIVRIAMNRAKTRAMKDQRSVAVPDFEPGPSSEPAVDPARFNRRRIWTSPPARWDETPEALLHRQEIRAAIEAALELLPESQRAVVTLRDLEGWSSEEVCNALAISESNQRVLLHRGRSRLRAALEEAHAGSRA